VSHSYNLFVNAFSQLLLEAQSMPKGGLAPAPAPRLLDNAPRVLVFAPHPDDESILGALPLRLRRELSHRVSAVAVTQGSRVDRQQERLAEMRQASHFLGFELISTRQNGLAGVNLRTRANNPDAWEEAVAVIAHIISYHRASLLFLPHDQDWHTTHIGTHHLVVDAMKTLGPGFRCKVVETEYWRPMENPNLMIGSSPEDVADLVAAVSFHQGELARNPFHLFLPAWMADNVRRGSELVTAQGADAQPFQYATRLVPPDGDLGEIFK
jgi:LmbE family N-acetylglucosaminyl deacetylase